MSFKKGDTIQGVEIHSNYDTNGNYCRGFIRLRGKTNTWLYYQKRIFMCSNYTVMTCRMVLVEKI